MSTFLEALALTALLGAVATLTGRCLVFVLDVSLLRRPRAEALLAAAVLGTGLLTLVFGWASYAGHPASGGLLLVGLLLVGLVFFLAVRGRLRAALRLPRPGIVGGVLLLALAAQTVVSLLPLAIGSIRYCWGDNAMYFGPAEWLQGHGFGTAAPPDDATQPMVWQVQQYHKMNHRMGPMFLLALLRAAVPFRLAAELYPAVLAWGAALNVAGVYLLARWGLRVPRFHAALGSLALAVTCNSLTLSSGNGFFCQVYGTAVLTFGLAVLSRLLAPSSWRPGHAALLGLTLATQFSMYSELSPLLGLAALAVAGSALWRRPHRPRLARFAGLVLIALFLLANFELVRATRSVLFMVRMNAVGWHIAWNSAQYARLAVGFFATAQCMRLGPPILGSLDGVAGAVAGVVCLLGLARVLRNRRALPLVTTALVLAGLAVCYRFGVRDPWTGEVGHTWNLFKLSKWSFAVVAPLQVAGAALLASKLPRPRLAAVLGSVAVAGCALIPHLRYAGGMVDMVAQVFGGPARLPELRQLCHRIDERAPRRLYVVSEPIESLPRWFPGCMLCPRPFANGWPGLHLFDIDESCADQPDAFEPGTLFLQHGVPPFAEPLERLPFGYSIVDGTRPLLFRVRTGDGKAWTLQGANGFPVGAAPVELFVLSPRAGPVVLSLVVREGTGRRELCVTDPAGTLHTLTVDTAGGMVLPVELPAGVSSLELTCPEGKAGIEVTGARVDTPRDLARR